MNSPTTAQGNLFQPQRFFGESLRMRYRLSDSDPANVALKNNLKPIPSFPSLASVQKNLEQKPTKETKRREPVKNDFQDFVLPAFVSFVAFCSKSLPFVFLKGVVDASKF